MLLFILRIIGQILPFISSEQILDKVGTGDCFMAGLIYGLYKQCRKMRLFNLLLRQGLENFLKKEIPPVRI